MSRSHARILVLDDDAPLTEHLVGRLQAAGYDVRGETSARTALERVVAEKIDLLITDVEMPELRGPDVLAAVTERSPGTLVIVMTAFGSIELAVRCVRDGAADFLAKPFPFEILRRTIDRALDERRMRREIVRLRAARTEPEPAPAPRPNSPSMRRALEICERAARVDAPVLFTGESGVGKTHFARRLHAMSPRATGPFVRVNCANLPATLVESELFGVRRGAYTDAHRDRTGRFQEAHGGTLLLDEIGEMPLELQPKLLQALETGAVRPVGADREQPVDVRLVAATNLDLRDAIRAGRFREDLYYRLNVVAIEVPPLRERREDILPLVDALLAQISARLERPVEGIAADALRWLVAQPWPGNVRELANVLERALVLAEHDTLVLEDFDLTDPGGDSGGDALSDLASRGWSLAQVQSAYVDAVLRENRQNKAATARQLGVDRRTLYRWLDGDPPGT